MQLRKSAILTAVLVVSMAAPVFAQQSSSRVVVGDFKPPAHSSVVIPDNALATGADVSLRTAINNREHYIYWSWLNSNGLGRNFNLADDRKKLRRQWQELLGVDVFMPYFKVKEVEDVVTSKTSVTFFNMKGKAQFNDKFKSVEYIFKKKF